MSDAAADSKTPEQIAAETAALNERRYQLYKRLRADPEFNFWLHDGLFKTMEDDALATMANPRKRLVSLEVARGLWLQAKELHEHMDKVIASFEAQRTQAALDAQRRADRAARKLPPDDE